MDQKHRTAELLAQTVCREIGLATRQWTVVHHQSRRLVDHDELRIVMDDGQWGVFRVV
jgi:hypothetical protein